MEIQHLRVFREVAQELSFTQAARNLYCAQSTVTGQIKSLEQALGAELFHRRGRLPIELTEAGARLRPRAEQILHAVETAVREVRTGVAGPAARARREPLSLAGAIPSQPRARR
ncbi:LysR family transcriptional regulator [Streptomyces sp. NPDC020719]|uniref:LysR family transcriptional regulator n=1 Tax=Streptomyces sp. NPDC020719 TaxID=3154896 RepID=UPI0033DB03A5